MGDGSGFKVTGGEEQFCYIWHVVGAVEFVRFGYGMIEVTEVLLNKQGDTFQCIIVLAFTQVFPDRMDEIVKILAGKISQRAHDNA